MVNMCSRNSTKASANQRWTLRIPYIDVLWLPRSTLRHLEDENTTDCIVVVGVSRPKLTLAILITFLISLLLSFHLLCRTALQNTSTGGVGANSNEVNADFYFGSEQHSRSRPVLLISKRLVAQGHQARRLPQAVIMGVRKGGTRALLEMLYLHPMVQKASGEVHFFDRDDNYNKGLEWYRMQMPYSYAGQITIEKSPSYFVTPEVPERIRAMNASIKLLLIVREPVTRAISDYTQLRANAATAAPTTTEVTPGGAGASAALAKSFEELTMCANGTINTTYRPLLISIYHMFLHHWLETFTREQILIVNGDALIEDPLSQVRKIEHFLGLEPRLGAHNFYFNETKGFYCLRNETADRCLKETKGRRHPRVHPEVVSRLRRYFGEHNQKFYELIGEDLGWPEE